MGREIRRVPAGWEHPKVETRRFDPRLGGTKIIQDYQPMHDEAFEIRARKWLDDAIAWDQGNDPHKVNHPFFWQWDGEPPDPKYYRPNWTDAERTHFQMYETVSEGTPVTPVFATKAELVDYLVEHGSTGDGRWPRANAEKFVEREWAPSMIVDATGVHAPKEQDL